MQQLFALALETGCPVWHMAFALRVANLAAKVCFAGCAKIAKSAFGGAESLQRSAWISTYLLTEGASE